MSQGNRFHSFSVIVPSDTVNNPFDGIYVGSTGNIVVVGEDNTVVTFNNVPVGYFRVAGRRVNSTNTTASNLVALRG